MARVGEILCGTLSATPVLMRTGEGRGWWSEKECIMERARALSQHAGSGTEIVSIVIVSWGRLWRPVFDTV